jgi:SAM-dependent methyltransferase
VPLEKFELLDPRPAEDALTAPFARAVNIPAGELRSRVHELPPEGARLLVAECAQSEDAIRTLTLLGRESSRVTASPASGSQNGRLWQPSEFVEASVGGIAVGSAIDIACGAGRDSVLVSSAGFSVFGVDILPDAVARARDLARRYVPDGNAVFEVGDAESEEFGGGTTFALVLMSRFLHRPLLARIRELISPGGTLLVETFTERHRERNARPNSPDHLLHEGELLQAASDLDVVEYSEAWRGDKHTARLWARRP